MRARALAAVGKQAALGKSIAKRHATSLPHIPGVIYSNSEIPEDKLIGQVRAWAASSQALSQEAAFDLLQVAENVAGTAVPRVVCGIWRTRFRLAEEKEPVPCMATLFYRTRDYLSAEFWEDQIRRICDIVAEEYLGAGPGVQLMIHHGAPWAMGLEVGEHRLLAEVEAFTFFGPQRAIMLQGETEVIQADSAKVLADRHQLFNVLLQDRKPPGGKEASLSPVAPGHYLLRLDGEEVCGVEVLGTQPWQLVLGSPWAKEGHEASLAHLATVLRRRAGSWGCSFVYDARDERGLWLSEKVNLGLRRKKALRLAVTGVPMGLSEEQQTRLARAPFLIPWEFLPFHSGRLVVI